MLGRLRQVIYYVRPRLPAADLTWAHALLNPAQRGLFDAMTLPDRAHAVRVAKRLAAQAAPAHALEAALLHDCGKPPGYGLVARVVGVLCARWGAAPPEGPRQPGWQGMRQAYHWHDAWGLAAARAAGTSVAALALLESYQAHGPDDWSRALQQADDRG